VSIAPLFTGAPGRGRARKSWTENPRYRSGISQDFFRGALRDNFSSRLASFGSQINKMVGSFDDFQVVFDDDDRVPGVDQAVQDLEKLADIIKMQTGRGLIKNIQVLPVARLDSSRDSLTRCASPPESVVACWPNLMYPMPTSFRVCSFPRILGIGSKNLKA